MGEGTFANILTDSTVNLVLGEESEKRGSWRDIAVKKRGE